MRLTTVILIATLMQVSAATFGQSITINERKASFEQVLKSIRSQSGYDVIMDRNILKKAGQVNISVKDATIDEAMKSLLAGLPLKYTIDGKIIVIEEKSGSIIDNIIARFQAIDVRGKVVDSLGNGLAGATVSVKNGKGSTSTDAGGNFQLRNVDEGVVLVVSYLGYVTREVALSKDFNYIQLLQSESKLDEVKVIAYGTTTQRLSTGNTQGIKASDIERQPVNNPLYALQGRIAGLQITPTSGLAGGAVSIQIRGKNTLSNTYDAIPLVVIDGLPVSQNISGLGHPGFQNNNGNQLSALSFINPQDIESIDVLKDADATSIYGSRGSNGVILITTKKGKQGQTKINLNLQSGIGEVAKKMSLLNTSQYLELRREAYLNSGVNLATAAPSVVTADVKLWDQNRYTDWQDVLIGGTAKYTDLQGSVSGGTANTQYLISGNFHKETTVFPGSNSDQKGNVHLNVTGSSPNKRFTSSITASFMSDNNTLPGVDYTTLSVTLAPNAPSLYNSNGTLNYEPLPSGARSWDNPLYQLNKTYDSRIKNLVSGADLSYELFTGLKIRTQLGYNLLDGSSFRKNSPFLNRAPESVNSPASVSFTETHAQNYSIEPQLNYSRSIFGGKFEFLIGGSMQSTFLKSQDIFANGITSDALSRNLQSATTFNLQNSSSEYKYNAVFSRVNYVYREKYIVNLAARRDGSSRFGPDQQFGNFGSIGTAWIFSEESIIKEHIPSLSYGKLRFSYGSSGNDNIGDYAYLERYEPISGVDNYDGSKGIKTLGLFNSYYAWEVTRKMEFGLESGFFSNRIFINAGYFRNRSSNQLRGLPLPTMAGPGGIVYNFPALIQNSGIELLITTENLKGKNFSWSTSINFTRNTNKLIAYPELETSQDYADFEIGRPFFGLAKTYKFYGVNSQTGNYQFQNINGSIVTDPADFDRIDGGRYLQTDMLPKFYGGMSNTLKYKGFNLDFLFQFVKQKGLSPIIPYLSGAGRIGNLPSEFLSRWRKEGDITEIQKVFSTTPPEAYNQTRGRVAQSDFVIVDASFLRLKNVSISYDFPTKAKDKISLNSLRLFVQGQNLWTLTKYKGLDPETQSRSALPPLRVITAGLQIGL